MGFSITSAVFGGLIIICYSVSIDLHWDYDTRDYHDYPDRRLRNYHSKMVISICMLLLGITEFVIGIWASTCCCLMKPCSGGCCCEAVPQHQVRIFRRGGGDSLVKSEGTLVDSLSVFRTEC